MAEKNILYLSWQGGLGHITRDVAIAKELHRLSPHLNVSWIAHPLARKVLEQAGETILPESRLSADYNRAAADCIEEFGLNLMHYVKATRKPYVQNVGLFSQVMSGYNFDLVIGDESYEVVRALGRGEVKLQCPMIIIEDFVGIEATTHNPLEKLGVHMRNRSWARYTERLEPQVTHFFVGEPEDIVDRPFGLGLPNRRQFARDHYRFLGYIIPFNPDEYADKSGMKTKLGYDQTPLLICSTGGTCAGKELLELCGKAYTLLKAEVPDLHMVCVCGELFGYDRPTLPPEVELHSFIPDLYQHYAACDMAVVVGGGTTTVELTALRRPFIFFPLENQFDQQLYVAERLARHRAGIRMKYDQTTPKSLAATILANIGKDVDHVRIPADGARTAARYIAELLSK
ncbi:MAG: glycosyltransferase [Candidatus Thorarchaeota archaeon]